MQCLYDDGFDHDNSENLIGRSKVEHFLRIYCISFTNFKSIRLNQQFIIECYVLSLVTRYTRRKTIML